MGRLKELIENLSKVVKDLDLSVNDSIIFEQACSYHRGELINRNFKENRDILKPQSKSSGDTPKQENKGLPATDKQIDFLIKLGFTGNMDNLSKVEAIQIIKELKENRRFKQ